MPINREKEQDILDNVKQEERLLKEFSDSFGMNKMNQETLQAIEDTENGKLHGRFSSVEELMKDLNETLN